MEAGIRPLGVICTGRGGEPLVIFLSIFFLSKIPASDSPPAALACAKCYYYMFTHVYSVEQFACQLRDRVEGKGVSGKRSLRADVWQALASAAGVGCPK